MCSNFCQDMNSYQGDLADIIRATGGVMDDSTTNSFAITTSTSTTTTKAMPNDQQMPDWRFASSDISSSNQQAYQLKNLYAFQDPLLRDMDTISSPGPFLDVGVEDNNIGRRMFSAGDGSMQVSASTPSNNLCNMFSPRMVQISSNTSSNNNSSSSNSSNNNAKLPILAASPKVIKTSFGFMSNEMMSVNASCSSPKDGFVGGTTGVQIPSPRNPGIKRRKSQAKKVVCIPAPAVANSRQTGEVVPSDLWAWRKYGQKPIKGSPYPRGYYRCSSSKGCSARKQVERSRTDPKMLVITYTSEHNHPWPTQRNALAGSTRSQPSKGGTGTTQNDNSEHPQCQNDGTDGLLIKSEINNKEGSDTIIEATPLANYNNASACNSTTKSSMNEEEAKIEEQEDNTIEQSINEGYENHQFSNSYRPLIMPETNIQQQADQDFFANLVEFEGDDPLNLLFTQETKGADPFSGLFDWTTNTTTNT